MVLIWGFIGTVEMRVSAHDVMWFLCYFEIGESGTGDMSCLKQFE